MRLYLEADSQKNIGYTPDWIQCSFFKNNKEYLITFDINALIDYSCEKLDCRCKGELIPWTLYEYDADGYRSEEIDLQESKYREYVEKYFTPKRIAEIIQCAVDFTVGIYPADEEETYPEDEEYAKQDTLSLGTGLFEYCCDNVCISKEFEFVTELNI